MAYFKNLEKAMTHLLSLFTKEERWLITIIADPDAVASALALQRIMLRRVKNVTIATPTQMTRPDNLAMLRLLRINIVTYTEELVQQYDRFAIVDSQPDHYPGFAAIDYSIVVDHHPEKELVEYDTKNKFIDIRPQYGATSTILTEYLYNLDIQPSAKIATALQLGIRTDTGLFERSGSEVDMRAFQYLAKFANPELRSHILKSEYRMSWLPYFSIAFANFIAIQGNDAEIFTFLPDVPNADILVSIADFNMRIQEIAWVAVAGRVLDKIVIIFRGGDLDLDLGNLATIAFSDIGSAGGHRNMARAEIPVENIGETNIVDFLLTSIADAMEDAVDVLHDDE